MRDYPSVHSNSDKDAVYKDVVMIGNGPSGLSLSFMLSGKWPHYNGRCHPDTMLEARMNQRPQTESVLLQDLEHLAQGLEGRSRNPVAVLVDQLMHPGADQGLDCHPVLDWKSHHRPVDHVVIGKGPPGGAWQAMDGNILTLSLSSWMELPGLRFDDWSREHRQSWSHERQEASSTDQQPPTSGPRRITVEQVANYYTDYVHKNRLWRYQRRGEVTNVRLNNEEFSEGGGPPKGVPTWRVEGTDSNGKPMTYLCRCLVLATGSTDIPNRLNIPGEEDSRWVHHDLRHLEDALEEIGRRSHPSQDRGDVLVVGAGLSAADAVLGARFHGLRVIHVFRRPTVSTERTLPESVYPEYHKVHQMMSACGVGYPGYTALVGYSVAGFRSNASDSGVGGCVELVSPEGKSVLVEVAVAGVLIGSRPDLTFLPEELDQGRNCGVIRGLDIDCRSNPLAIDPWTHSVILNPKEVTSEGEDVDKQEDAGSTSLPDLYAVGPLAGDNFVRFIVGGAVATAASIVDRLQLTVGDTAVSSE